MRVTADWGDYTQGLQVPSATSTPVAPPVANLRPPPDDPDPPAPYDAATGVSIAAPSTMAPGSTAYVTVTIRNSGTTTWYPGLSYPYRLGSQNPQDNTTWGMGRVDLGSTVAPGSQAVFGFTITAPTTPGTYTFGWAMLREGMHWFGGNISSTITVAAPAPVYDAQLVSASVPATMTPGGGYNVSMTFRNSGNTTWTSPDFLLATPDDNVAFGMNRMAMSPSTVAPGQNATFNFQVSAPSSAGTYTFQWGMVWEFHQRFGQTSTTSVTVGGANGSVTYIHTDGLGSPVARTDSAGNVISRTRYEPYGYVASGVQPTIGFTGHVNDVETGLTYMQQRYYDPVAGRFLSIDPVTTDANTGGSFNRYAYANNSPYRYIDPDGRQVARMILSRPPAGIPGRPLQSPDGSLPPSTPSGATIRLPSFPIINPLTTVITAAQILAANLTGNTPPQSPVINPADVAGKTPAEIGQVATGAGLVPKGPDPLGGRGSFDDPVTGEQRVLVHGDHAHVNDPEGKRLDVDGNRVNPKSEAAHLPVKQPES